MGLDMSGGVNSGGAFRTSDVRVMSLQLSMFGFLSLSVSHPWAAPQAAFWIPSVRWLREGTLYVYHPF